MNNKLVFTNHAVVVRFIGDDTDTIPADKYLQEFEKKLNNDDCSIFFSMTRKAFYITEDGIEFDVVLPDDDEKSLNNNMLTPLISNLIYLVKKYKGISEEKNVKAVKEAKIKAMENSNYEDIEDVEDLELYLDYLKTTVVKTAKTREEKCTLITKMIGIFLLIKRKKKEDDSKIPSPLDLRLYLEGFVSEVTNKSERLERSKKIALLNKVQGIVMDYKKINDILQGKRFSLDGGISLTISFLNRIDEVEKIFRPSSQIEKDLSQIMEELKEFANINPSRKR